MGETAKTLLNQSVNQLLDQLADRIPTPGGGAAASMAGALASAIARMVGAYSLDKQGDRAQQQQISLFCEELARADRMLRRLMDEDAAAYERLSRARRAVRDDPQHADQSNRALALALAVPLEIAAVASGALAVMKELQPLANNHLLSDLGAAAVLADACVQAAAYSVRVNATQLPDESQRREVLEQIARVVRHSDETRRAIEASLPQEIRS